MDDLTRVADAPALAVRSAAAEDTMILLERMTPSTDIFRPAPTAPAQTPGAADAPGDEVYVSVIVPALNEAENLPLLLPRIDAALKAYLGGKRYEVRVVDDNSPDATALVCAELSAVYPLTLMVRPRPADGLSGAVLHGMAAARGRYVAVMDADLQHPPEKLPELLEPLARGEAEFCLGSRYAPGGTTAGRWGVLRRVNSTAATLLARPFAGRTHDPMSGFFALARSTYRRAERLTPMGYKIALELMCKCRVGSVKEVPIHFALRTRGRSKLSLREQFRYLEHLSRLYDFKYPRASPVAKFLAATAAAWFAGLAVAVTLLSFADPRSPGAALSAAGATAAGYLGAAAVLGVFHARYVRAQRRFLLTRRPWLDFALMSLAEWAACAAAAFWLARRLDRPRPAEIFVLGFGAATALRYLLRKELLHDLRGLRRDLRAEEIGPQKIAARGQTGNCD